MDTAKEREVLNSVINEEFEKLPKDTICCLLRETYGMSEQQADDAWGYLEKTQSVLFEFKHYAATGSFLPDDRCYRVQGYSAEQLCRSTFLTPLGAFSYLIYLQERPEEALANLKAGLPRR